MRTMPAISGCRRAIPLLAFLLTWLGAVATSADEVSRTEMRSLDDQVQVIKSDVLSIAAELNQLEEKLLYPSNTQVAVFVAIAEEESVFLDSVKVQIDDRNIAIGFSRGTSTSVVLNRVIFIEFSGSSVAYTDNSVNQSSAGHLYVNLVAQFSFQ